MNEVIEIDGSVGEGGGQVLRTSLTLSILTQQPVHIHQIRANRNKPGLMAQHLQAVQSAKEVSQAEVKGNIIGSEELFFKPNTITHGRYHFEIGTAGSTSLVFQTILLPLSMAARTSTIDIQGGTHVQWSPVFHYLDLHWLEFMRRIGFNVNIDIVKAGFYPLGGGEMTAKIKPMDQLTGLHLNDRGKLISINGISAVGNLDISIATRQKHQALRRLEPICPNTKIKSQEIPAHGKGTFFLLIAEFEEGRCCYSSLGSPGKRAEIVADEAVDALLAFIDSGAAVDEYLADQMLLPLILSKQSSSFSTNKVTQHLLTNASIIHQFTPARIEISGILGKPGIVNVIPVLEKRLPL